LTFARGGKHPVMARAIWSGSISFGLVNVPVQMFSAVHEQTLHFRLVHLPDDAPIGYRKVCKEEDKPVPDEEIVRAFDADGGETVYLTDEDFEAAEAESYKTIQILDFVPHEQVDPSFFERTYHLGPREGAESPYRLLAAAMSRSGLTAVARYVSHRREHLAALRVRDGVLVLERMYHADELSSPQEVAPPEGKVKKEELEVAEQLIQRMARDFAPDRYPDLYRERLLEVIEQKREGREVHVTKPEEPEAPKDLMAALRESLERAGAAPKGAKGNGGRASGAAHDGELDDLSVDELRDRAKDAGIRGRSKMRKDELVAALHDAA
jgi:DNA end-binding protein Ku